MIIKATAPPQPVLELVVLVLADIERKSEAIVTDVVRPSTPPGSGLPMKRNREQVTKLEADLNGFKQALKDSWSN